MAIQDLWSSRTELKYVSQEEKVGEMIAEGTPEVVAPACAQICEESGSSKKKKKKATKKKKKQKTKQKAKPEL